jgi:uncharacterized protein
VEADVAAILKFVLLALLGLWLWYSPAVRKLWRPDRPADTPSHPEEDSAPPSKEATSTPATPENMVRCAHCGLHLPEGEAVKAVDGHHYCTTTHRDLGPCDHG